MLIVDTWFAALAWKCLRCLLPLTLTGFLISGCNSVWFDPYIDLPNRDLATDYEAFEEFPRLLTEANKAEELRRTARSYRENLQIGRSLLGYGTFGAAAAGGITALYGAHPDLVLGLGIGAASAYGAGSLFASTDRIDIYSATNRALNCVVGKADFVLGTAMSLDQLTSENTLLTQNRNNLSSLIDELSFSSEPELQENALKALSTYDAAIRNLQTFKAQDPNFAVAVTRTRNTIIHAMEEKVRATQPSIDTILKAAQSIGIAGVAYTKAVTPSPPPPEPLVESAVAELNKLKKRIMFLTEEVSFAANDINNAITKATNEMDQLGTVCVLDLPAIAELSISPSEVTVAKDQTITLRVSGGKEPFTTTWRGTSPRNNQIDIVPSGQSILVIGNSALESLPRDTALELVITDSLAAPNEVVIKVTPLIPASPSS